METTRCCETCAHWNPYQSDVGFAICDAAATPDKLIQIGRKNASMMVPAGAELRTTASHVCGQHADLPRHVLSRRIVEALAAAAIAELRGSAASRVLVVAPTAYEAAFVATLLRADSRPGAVVIGARGSLCAFCYDTVIAAAGLDVEHRDWWEAGVLPRAAPGAKVTFVGQALREAWKRAA